MSHRPEDELPAEDRIAAALERIADVLEASTAARQADRRAAILSDIEAEGVVTWGDPGHRERFLAEL